MTAAPLSGLPSLLAGHPTLLTASSGTGAPVAVPDSARSIWISALATTTARVPVVLAVPTAAEAERLAHDAGQMLGTDAVELFPAWQTLPFERVSPNVKTMGRRLRVMWRLRNTQHPPQLVWAPVRALLQRLDCAV